MLLKLRIFLPALHNRQTQLNFPQPLPDTMPSPAPQGVPCAIALLPVNLREDKAPFGRKKRIRVGDTPFGLAKRIPEG